MFARGVRPPRRGKPEDEQPSERRLQIPMASRGEKPLMFSHGVFSVNEEHGPPPESPRLVTGWLHTYRTKESTPLLYIDSMSAGKCNKGTLDTQDTLLLNVSYPGEGVFWERERAAGLCGMASKRGVGKVKGFVRMEAGFEIIMCSFSDGLDFVGSTKAGPFVPKGDNPDSEDKGFPRTIWDWIKSVTARYDEIGGGRVKLEFENFVTAYNYDLDLFSVADDDLPRLTNLSDARMNGIRRDVDAMMWSWTPARMADQDSIHWQEVADMAVVRYGKLLKYLVSGAVTTTDKLLRELRPMLRVSSTPTIETSTQNYTVAPPSSIQQMEIFKTRLQLGQSGTSRKGSARPYPSSSMLICHFLCHWRSFRHWLAIWIGQCGSDVPTALLTKFVLYPCGLSAQRKTVKVHNVRTRVVLAGAWDIGVILRGGKCSRGRTACS